MKLKSNASMAKTRQEASFRKGEYRGMNTDKLVIRPGGLDVLSKPSRIGNTLHEYKLVFKQESKDGDEDNGVSSGSKRDV